MGLSLEENIERYGGKHGGLLHVRENVAGGQIVPTFELLEPGQNYNWATRRAVLAACKETGAQGVIVRTSEKSDWRGMVDTMPTVVTSDWSLSIMRAISKVRRRCEDKGLLKYAETEGNGYDPGRVTVSIAPYFRPAEESPRTLITQHPTLDGVHLADASWQAYSNGQFDHQSFDFDAKGGLLYEYLGKERLIDAEKASALVRQIEKAGVLPKTEAFQFEGGFNKGQPQLFQVRHLADRRSADFRLNKEKRPQFLRDFGVTPSEGVELEVVRMGTRGEFANFEAQNPGVNYLLIVDSATDQLAITDQPTNMQGYMINMKPALSHQATRLVQMSLRNSNGVTSLASLGKLDNLRHGNRVRIIADGLRQRIEVLG